MFTAIAKNRCNFTYENANREINYFLLLQDQKRKLVGLFTEFKLNPLNFHSLDTFGCFIRYSLNLTKEQVKEIISNPQIQVWIDRNKCHGFVYQTYPKSKKAYNN